MKSLRELYKIGRGPSSSHTMGPSKAATRALDANFYAMLSDGRYIVSFDDVVGVMKQTGHDLPNLYKETGVGGLAASYRKE